MTGPAPATDKPVSPDEYCVRVRRFGALGEEEKPGRIELHRAARAEVEAILELTLVTLGPGDRSEVTLWRGHHA